MILAYLNVEFNSIKSQISGTTLLSGAFFIIVKDSFPFLYFKIINVVMIVVLSVLIMILATFYLLELLIDDDVKKFKGIGLITDEEKEELS